MASDLRERKRLVTRQTISDAATALFFQHGFDQVTIEQIATAAQVGRMTVFNYFPRKEDLFFDRDEQGRVDLLQALEQRPAGLAPSEALRLAAHRLMAEDCPYLRFSDGALRFIDTCNASATLKARARAIRDELTAMLTQALYESVATPEAERDAELAAHWLLAGWSVAFLQAHQVFRESESVAAAQRHFLQTIDRCHAGLAAALQGSVYV